MIIRTLINHLKTQNWLAAGVDLIIVIAGIFLGLQANEWNEQRRAEEQEVIYLERLLVNLENDELQWNRNKASALNSIEQIDFLISALGNEDILRANPKDFVFSIRQAAWSSQFVPDDTAWSELQATGRALLISSPPLRREIAQYYGNFERASNQWNSIYREMTVPYRTIISGTIPPHLEKAIRSDATIQESTVVSIDEALTARDKFLARPKAWDYLMLQLSLHQNRYTSANPGTTGYRDSLLKLRQNIHNHLASIKNK